MKRLLLTPLSGPSKPLSPAELIKVVVALVSANGMSFLVDRRFNIVARVEIDLSNGVHAISSEFSGTDNNLGAKSEVKSEQEFFEDEFNTSGYPFRRTPPASPTLTPTESLRPASSKLAAAHLPSRFLDPRMAGQVLEHTSLHENRLLLWEHIKPLFVDLAWIFQGTIKQGDFASLLTMLEKLVNLDASEATIGIVAAMAGLAIAPAKVNFIALVANFHSLRAEAVTLGRDDPALRLGSGFLPTVFLRHLSKDKAFAPALAAFNQARRGVHGHPSLDDLFSTFGKVAPAAGASAANPLAFPAVVKELVRVCYAFQRTGSCLRGDKCGFSHDPKVIAKAPPPPERADRAVRQPRGGCIMCQSKDHGIERCPDFLAVKAAKAKAAPVGYVAKAGPPSSASADPAQMQQAMLALQQQMIQGGWTAPAAAVAPVAPAVPAAPAASLAVVGRDDELQQMLNNAKI